MDVWINPVRKRRKVQSYKPSDIWTKGNTSVLDPTLSITVFSNRLKTHLFDQ